MHERFHSLLVALVVAVCLAGCSSLDELTTITLGEGDIEPFVYDERHDLAEVPIEGCVRGSFTVPTDRGTATVTLAPDAMGCHLTFALDDAVLFDEGQVRDASAALDGWEVDSVREIRLRVSELLVRDDSGASLLEADYVMGFELRVDDTALLTEADLPIGPNQPVTRALPQSTTDRAVQAVMRDEAVTARIELRLILDTDRLMESPAAIRARAVAQPIVDVDVVDAVL